MRPFAAAAVAVLVLGLTGCASQDHEDARGRGDAPVAQESGHGGDDSPAFCSNMPDDFGNVCGKCVKHFPPWAFLVTTSTSYAPSQLTVFPAPAQCGGKIVSGMSPMNSNGSAAVPDEDDG